MRRSGLAPSEPKMPRGPPSGCADAGSFVHDFPSSGLADALLHRHRSVRHVSPAAVDHPRARRARRGRRMGGHHLRRRLSRRRSHLRVVGRPDQPLPGARHRAGRVRPGQPRHGTGRLVRRALGRPCPGGAGRLRRHPLGLRPGRQRRAARETGDVAGCRDLRATDRPDHRRTRGHPHGRRGRLARACSWSWRSRAC